MNHFEFMMDQSMELTMQSLLRSPSSLPAGGAFTVSGKEVVLVTPSPRAVTLKV